MSKRKKKYSNELKLKIVQECLEKTSSLGMLSKKYNVHKGDIQKWRDAYLEHGIDGIVSTNGSYSGDFKVSAVEYMYTTGSSFRKTMAHFNIKSLSTIIAWERIYSEEGPEALYKESRGGRSSKKKMSQETKKKSNDTSVDNAELLAEIKRLRMENEYLKKLNALVQERESSKKKTK